MAAKLQCEICGGKLIGRPGGVFECDSCGMEYDTAWAKAKIQEITGTVKVEGTVEVTGKVQVDGPVKVEGSVNKETLLQRGRLALQDGKWDKAKEFFDQALTLDAEYADAWLGLTMAELKLNRESEFESKFMDVSRAEWDPNYKRFLMFAAPERGREIAEMLERAENRRQKHFDELLQEKRRKLEEENEEKRQREAAEIAAHEAHLKELTAVRERIAPARKMIEGGNKDYALGLTADGTLLSTWDQFPLQPEWKNLVDLAVGEDHCIGLKPNGTVVAMRGKNMEDGGQCDVSEWQNIVEIDAGKEFSVGLKADGTVVTAGFRHHTRGVISEWTDGIAIAAGGNHIACLRADGTVVATGSNEEGACNVSLWKDIIAISAGSKHTVGLKKDGTVVACGLNFSNQCNVSGWKDVVEIAAGFEHTVGLKADGTVLATGSDKTWHQCNVSGWKDVVAISAGGFHTIGLKADGKVLAAGMITNCQGNRSGWTLFQGQSTIPGWTLFNSIDTIEEERTAAREGKIAGLKAERKALNEELPTIKGIFAGSKKAKIEARLAEIDSELNMLGVK